MRKIFTAALPALALLGAAACGGPPAKADQTELIVFAAASLTDSLRQIAGMYAEAEPRVKLTFDFDSSGTLKTQIQEGADCDVFISAAEGQMDNLDAAARVDLLENRAALVVPAGNPANIHSFADMAAALSAGKITLAMGNGDVPAGQYAQRILKYYGLDERALAKAGGISYGSDVREVAAQVAEGSVGCGVVYLTDAKSAGLNAVDCATADMCGRVLYPAAVLKTSKNPAAARAFLDYLNSAGAAAVFESAGFTKP